MSANGEPNDFIKENISSTIMDLDKIFKSGIFTIDRHNDPLLRAAFTYTLILLRDLIYQANEFGDAEVRFTDDIVCDSEVKDIDGLIRYARNAACHLNSDNHYAGDNFKFSFNIIFGKASFMVHNGIEISSFYEDDICLFFGNKAIYLNRHIKRAFEEAKVSLKKHIPSYLEF